MKNIKSVTVALSILAIVVCGVGAAVATNLTESQKTFISIAIPDKTLADEIVRRLDLIDAAQEMTAYVATLTTDFDGVLANACKVSAAVTVTGAAASDICSVGAPAAVAGSSLQFTCTVSAADAVKVKVCNPTASLITGLESGDHNIRVEAQ